MEKLQKIIVFFVSVHGCASMYCKPKRIINVSNIQNYTRYWRDESVNKALIYYGKGVSRNIKLTEMYFASRSIRSASLLIRRPLAEASIRLHGDPNLKALRAALTAKSTSAFPQKQTNKQTKWAQMLNSGQDHLIQQIQISFGLLWAPQLYINSK